MWIALPITSALVPLGERQKICTATRLPSHGLVNQDPAISPLTKPQTIAALPKSVRESFLIVTSLAPAWPANARASPSQTVVRIVVPRPLPSRRFQLRRWRGVLARRPSHKRRAGRYAWRDTNHGVDADAGQAARSGVQVP